MSWRTRLQNLTTIHSVTDIAGVRRGATSTIQRTTLGLQFRDSWDNTQNGGALDGYNGWADVDGAFEMVDASDDPEGEAPQDHVIRGATSFNSAQRQVSGHDDGDFLVQVHSKIVATRPTQTLFRCVGFDTATGLDNDGYSMDLRNTSPASWVLIRWSSGGESDVIGPDTTDQPVDDAWNVIRAVGEESGSNLKIRLYGKPNVTPLYTGSVDQKGSEYEDTSPWANDGIGLRGDDDSASNHVRWMDLILCSGFQVTVSGLATGEKVQIDSGTKVTESDGTATVNLESAGIPGTTIKVLGPSDAERASLSPGSGGVWPGDVYEAS